MKEKNTTKFVRILLSTLPKTETAQIPVVIHFYAFFNEGEKATAHQILEVAYSNSQIMGYKYIELMRAFGPDTDNYHFSYMLMAYRYPMDTNDKIG